MDFKLLHSIKNKNDEGFILNSIPFLCTADDAWLGKGYYFWDGFEDPAHRWGQTHCGGKFIITLFEISMQYDRLFDLLGNTSHIYEIKKVREQYQEKGIDVSNLTVIDFMNILRYLIFFDYDAIRAESDDCFSKYEKVDI